MGEESWEMNFAERVQMFGGIVEVFQGGQEAQLLVCKPLPTVGQEAIGCLREQRNEVADSGFVVVLETCVERVGEVKCFGLVLIRVDGIPIASQENLQEQAHHVLAGVAVGKGHLELRLGGGAEEVVEEHEACGFPHAVDPGEASQPAKLNPKQIRVVKEFHYAIEIRGDREGGLGCDAGCKESPVVFGEV